MNTDLIEALKRAGIAVQFVPEEGWDITLPPVPQRAELDELRAELQVMSQELGTVKVALDEACEQRDTARKGHAKLADTHAMLLNELSACGVKATWHAGLSRWSIVNEAATKLSLADERLTKLMAELKSQGVFVAFYSGAVTPERWEVKLPVSADYEQFEVIHARLLSALDHAGIGYEFNPVRRTWQVKNKRVMQLMAAMRAAGVRHRYETNGGWKIYTNSPAQLVINAKGRTSAGMLKPISREDICKAFGVKAPDLYGELDMGGVFTLHGADVFYGVPVPKGCGFTVDKNMVSITVDNLRLMLMSARVH